MPTPAVPPPPAARQLVLHGSPAVVAADGPTIALSAREAALLAWLHREGPSPRARIAGTLWPAGTEAQARANLRQLLARLRRAAGPLVDDDGAGGLALAAGLAVAPARGARLLGPLEFDDAPAFADWLQAQREAETREQLREGLAAGRARLEAGDTDGALAAADAVLAADDTVEEAHRLRMQAFWLRGDRAAAVGAWDACRDALRRAFGLAPSAATEALGREILAAPAAPPAAAGPARTLPLALRRPPQLVGRDALLAELQRALALGRHLLVAGSGGIGKTRLLDALAESWGAAALQVGARPGDAHVPGAWLQRLVDAARTRYDPPLDDATQAALAALAAPGAAGARPPAAAAAPGALGSALDARHRLAALPRLLDACRARGLGLLLVDDLQFADAVSLAALRAGAAAVLDAAADAPSGPGAAGLRLAIAFRPDETEGDAAALVALLEQSGRTARFEPPPLDAAALRELVAALIDGPDDPQAPPADALAEALHARVGGQPAFVLEALRSLWLDGWAGWRAGDALPLPATLVDAVRRRLERLPEAALQIAQLAAVAGRDFGPALAAAALGRPPLALAPLWQALEAAQVFHGSGFGHDLVADAVRRTLPAALAPALHRLVAEHLAAHAGPPAAVAHHFGAAGEPAAAAPWQHRAAEIARDGWRIAEAEAAYRAAAQGHAAAGRRAERLDALLGAARCALWARRLDDAEPLLAAAEPLALGRPAQARWLTQRANADFLARNLGDALRHAARLLDTADAAFAALDALALADIARLLASCAAYGLPLAPALAFTERAIARLDGAGAAREPAAFVALQVARAGLLQWDGRAGEALAALEAAWAATDAAHDAGTRVLIANQRLRARHACGDRAGALADGGFLLEAAPPLDVGALFVADVLHVCGLVEIADGRPAAGLARLDAMQARLDSAGLPMPDLFVTSRALAAMAVGRLDAAAAVLAAHPPPGREGHALQDLGLLLTQGRLAWLRGESPAAPLAAAERIDGLPPGIALQRDVVLASMRTLTTDDLPACRARVQTLHARGLRGLLRTARVSAAWAALAAGRPDEAADFARAVLATVEHVDAWVDDRAGGWWGAIQVLARCAGVAGAADEAAAARRAAAAWVRARAADWGDDTAARRAWLEGQPAHRALLADDGPPEGRTATG